MNKEGRKALGHQQDASSIFTREAFILQMTPKNMYTTPWSARGKDKRARVDAGRQMERRVLRAHASGLGLSCGH